MTHVIQMRGSPYQKEERRFGPPLDYVGEKLRSALESAHRCAQNSLADDDPSARLAFHYGVLAYAALYVMLADWSNDINGLITRLLQMNEADFQEWLDLVQTEGDVLGQH